MSFQAGTHRNQDLMNRPVASGSLALQIFDHSTQPSNSARLKRTKSGKYFKTQDGCSTLGTNER